MPSILIVAPQADEAAAVCGRLSMRGLESHVAEIGALTCTVVPALDMLVAVGGNGKVQFAVQAQHLLDHTPGAALLVCVGTAGRLRGDLSIGDLVVGTCTVEHDYRERFNPAPLPRHEGDAVALAQLGAAASTATLPCQVHVGPIASGDEDIVSPSRSAELQAATGALCVAWEGSGGARAARFSGVGFIEIRAITDGADVDAAGSFRENLERVMPNIADLLIAWSVQLSARR